MALNRQNIPIAFRLGLNTKMDDKQTELGYLKRLENATFDILNKIKKRSGYDKVLTKLVDNSNISSALTLSKFKNELTLFNNQNLYSYSQALDKWSSKGRSFTAYPTSTTISQNDYNKSNLDIITSENMSVYAYEDSRGVIYSVRDNITGSLIVSDSIVAASASKPVLTSINNKVFIFYKESNSIKFKTLNLITPSTLSSATTAISDLHASAHNFDAVQYGTKSVIAYNNSTSVLSLFSVDQDGLVSSTLTLPGESASACINVYIDAQARIVVSYSNNTEIKMTIRSSSISGQILAPTVIETIANVKNVTTCQCVDNNMYDIIYEVYDANPAYTHIKKNSLTLPSTVGSASILMRSVGLASKAFCFSDVVHFAAVHSSTLQSTYFISDINGNIVSKVSPSISGGLITKGSLPKISELSSSSFLFSSLIKTKVVTDDGTFYSLLGINSTQLDFNPQDPYQDAELGSNVHIAGGILKMYDGSYISEHGFFLFPEDLTNPSNATTGGFLSDGLYQYSAVYAWSDSSGQIHRSAPSTPISITLSGATTTQKVTLRIPTLKLTDKQNVIIEVYRTEVSGDVFYKVSSTTSPTFNNKTVNYIDFEDTLADASIVSREILYTTGGVLENTQAPSSRVCEVYNDRIFLADKNKLIYSKIRDEGEAIEFNDALYKPISNLGGDITVMKTMDDKIIIFKKDAIYYMSGDGPNDLGEQDTFTEPTIISSDVGATDSKSVVLTPKGIMFKSRKGIYLLDRGLSTSYIGSPVEDYNSLTISSAIIVPSSNQVRFTTNDSCLVFNYLTEQWATFGNHNALSATSIENDYYYLRSDGIVYKENSSKFTDHGSSINISLETSWLSFADLQNFKRVYRLHLLGEFKSKHKLRIRIAYNFIEAFVHEEVIDVSDFTSSDAYGDSSPYGSESVYGGSGNLHQIRVDLKQQKCQSIKIRIEEIQDVETGEGLSLSNIMFEVGIKGTGNKPNQANVYGTNQ